MLAPYGMVPPKLVAKGGIAVAVKLASVAMIDLHRTACHARIVAGSAAWGQLSAAAMSSLEPAQPTQAPSTWCRCGDTAEVPMYMP